MKKIIVLLSAIAMFGLFANAQNTQLAHSKIVTLTESNFDATTQKGLYLVDFYADWCRPCKLMKPVLEEFATNYESKIRVVAVNTDFNKNLSTRFQVSGIPCLVLLKDGKEIKRLVGYREKAELENDLQQWIK
ncbi:MAG: thioredoxin [Bacteroidales bacterium]|jgi:thioredoxin 1